MRRVLFVVAALAFIASCAPYQLVEPPKRVKISETYTVSPQVKWSRVNNTFAKNIEQWTVDGAGLQALMFLNNVEDGQPIFRTRRKVKIPVFRSSMNTLEIKELFENSMAASMNNPMVGLEKSNMPADEVSEAHQSSTGSALG